MPSSAINDRDCYKKLNEASDDYEGDSKLACSIDRERIEETIRFHGHFCPGLAIGIRTAELAIMKLRINHSSDAVCVTETDMCGVDAIQFLTGCTYGNGNLIHKDYGKMAFTFFNRDIDKGFRAVLHNKFIEAKSDKDRRINLLLDADLTDLFSLNPVSAPPVRPAKTLESIVCDNCSEMTMESRIRLYDGKRLCFPCFENVEQKI